MKAEKVAIIKIGRKWYERKNNHDFSPDGCCHDCDVRHGEIHLIGCDVEMCPACEGQLISCECDHEHHVWDTESFQQSCPEINQLPDNKSKRLYTFERIAKKNPNTNTKLDDFN